MIAQKGKVVVLLFWTRDCINCKHNLGYWNDWAKRYSGTDVAGLSVHTPETRFERAPAATTRFARSHGLRFPILVDNDAHIWNAYGVQSWPTEVLIDKQGRIRAEFAGELNWEGRGEYKMVGKRIEALRAEGWVFWREKGNVGRGSGNGSGRGEGLRQAGLVRFDVPPGAVNRKGDDDDAQADPGGRMRYSTDYAIGEDQEQADSQSPPHSLLDYLLHGRLGGHRVSQPAGFSLPRLLLGLPP